MIRCKECKQPLNAYKDYRHHGKALYRHLPRSKPFCQNGSSNHKMEIEEV